MGVMLAIFQFPGTEPSSSDMLKSWQRLGAISFAVAFNNLPGILSGPQAFAGIRFSRAAMTSGIDRQMLDSRLFVMGRAVSAGGSDVAPEKTE